MHDKQKAVYSNVDIRSFGRPWIIQFIATDIMLLAAMKAMCQISPISVLSICCCKYLGIRINTLIDICVFDITKTREIPVKVWKLQ